jgi:hypothetical protein
MALSRLKKAATLPMSRSSESSNIHRIDFPFRWESFFIGSKIEFMTESSGQTHAGSSWLSMRATSKNFFAVFLLLTSINLITKPNSSFKLPVFRFTPGFIAGAGNY